MSKHRKSIKKVKNETKKAVSEAKTQDFDELYQSLRIKREDKTIYMLAYERERKKRDLNQVKCVKDEEDKILVHQKDINDTWKT